jgi:hypothetical protein
MTQKEILQIITDNFLVVRRLPFEVISYWSYTEGDENKKYVDSNGNPSKSVKSVVVQEFDLEHFQKTPASKYDSRTPGERYDAWKKNFPNGRKLLKEVRQVEKGGWWYVKEVNDTSSTVRFSREYDNFFAPTLEEAIQLYLNSKL